MIETAIQILAFLMVVALVCSITILPIMSIFLRLRPAAGTGYVISSYVFGITLWIACALTVYSAWGLFGFIVGVMLFGIGVLPLSLWIMGWNADWYGIGVAVVMIVAVVGMRLIGVKLIEEKR